MQHPVAYRVADDGRVFVTSLSGLLTNPWLFWQFTHNMTAMVVTASCVVAAVGAYYLLSGQHQAHAKTFLRTGVVVGAISSGLYLVGQPNLETMTIDNPIEIPGALSFLVYKDLYAKVKGLDAFPRDEWPDNLPLLYYAYHVMAGLGTIFALLYGTAFLSLWLGWLFSMKWLLWWLMLCAPFPYIATSAGWLTAELVVNPGWSTAYCVQQTVPRHSCIRAMPSLP